MSLAKTDADETIQVDIGAQEKMSAVLNRKGRVTTIEMKTFAAQIEAINNLPTKTPAQLEFVADCLSTMIKLNAKLGQVEREQEVLKSKLSEKEAEKAKVEAENQYEELLSFSPLANRGDTSFDVKKDTITPASMVRTPEKFDGRKPNPRRFVDFYVKSISLNGWTNRIAVKYFSSYLEGTALSWFNTEVAPTMTSSTTIEELVDQFNSYYLGEAELERLAQQVEEARQRNKESIREFIPRYREMLLLLDPQMSDQEQKRRIIPRLRPEYKTWVNYASPKTVTELRECCVRVEAGFNRDNHEEKSNDDKTQNEKEKSPGSGGTSDQKKTNPKCYRCERLGHVAKHCRANKKADGSPCNPKPDKSKRPVNSVSEEVKEPAEVLTVKHVCSVFGSEDWEDEDQKVMVNHQPKPTNLVVGGGKLLQQEVKVNGETMRALIDTGASVSVINYDVVKEKSWTPNKPIPELVGADGGQLKSIGGLIVDLEMKLGRTTKKTSTNVAVVAGLAMPLLLGLRILAKLEVVIDVAEAKLSFRASSKRPGVRVREKTLVPARTQMVVQATCNTIGSVMVIPFHSRDEIVVANSISTVIDNQMEILVANCGPRDKSLEAGLQLASYEPLDSSLTTATAEQIMRISEIPNTNEIVNIGDGLSEDQVQDLQDLFERNKDCFSINGEIGSTNLTEHVIELEANAKPFAEPLRRRAHAQIEETKKQVKKMLQEGVIEESTSPWASAYVLAKEKSGDYRLCVDFRKLNNLTKKVAYPLPNIDGCLDTLAGKRYFSLIDFASGFWQVPMAPEARELTAFRTEDGQFQFKKMPFGLTNAPATFQRMINALLTGLKGVSLQCFIDDICIANDAWDEHLEMLDQVMNVVRRANLKLKSSKCTFGAEKVVFLGHEISADGIRQEQEKVRALENLSAPTDQSGVRRVLGMMNHYRKFVENFAMKAAPLTRLTRKKVSFHWGPKEQEAFDQLKDSLRQNAVLAHFRHTDQTMLKTDASRVGVAGILLQLRNDEWRIISCCSRRLSEAEANYGITDLEGLAIVYAVTKYRHYLLGIYFKIITDHCALCVLKEKMPNSPRIRRWALLLSEYNFDVVYTKGTQHGDVDCLSRAPVDNAFDTYLEDRVNTVIVPRNKFEWIRDHDNEESKAILQKTREKKDGLRLSFDVVYKGTSIYVPPPRREEALKDAHQAAGHGSIASTVDRTSSMWWPTKEADVRKFVENCLICQTHRVERLPPAGGMFHHDVYEPLARVAVDCLGPVIETLRGNRHVMVALDSFTRFIEAKAVPEVTAGAFTQFLTDYCGRYGVPHELQTDNASTFTGGIAKEMMKVFAIKHLLSAPLHSQGNAIAERAIQTLRDKLAMISADRQCQNDWDVVLPVAVLSINTTRHRTTGYTPFQMLYGRKASMQVGSFGEQPVNSSDLHVKLIEIHLNECRESD